MYVCINRKETLLNFITKREGEKNYLPPLCLGYFTILILIFEKKKKKPISLFMFEKWANTLNLLLFQLYQTES